MFKIHIYIWLEAIIKKSIIHDLNLLWKIGFIVFGIFWDDLQELNSCNKALSLRSLFISLWRLALQKIPPLQLPPISMCPLWTTH